METDASQKHISDVAISMLNLLNIKQVQQIVGGKSRSTLYRWIADGSFPAPIKVCGSSMWPMESIVHWRDQLLSQK